MPRRRARVACSSGGSSAKSAEGRGGLDFEQGANESGHARAGQLGVGERRLADEHFAEQGAEAVDVATRIDGTPVARDLFRAHVGGGADELGRLGVLGPMADAFVDGLGDAEVDQLGRGPAALGLGHQDVGGLDVTMDDASAVGVGDGVANLGEKIEAGGQIQREAIAVGDERFARHMLHDEVGPARGGGAGVVNAGDVWMVHQRQRLTFEREARHHLLGVHTEADDLECDLATNRLVLLGEVNDAAGTLADASHQPVAIHHGRMVGQAGQSGEGRRVVEKRFGGRDVAQEQLDARAEVRIVGAGVVEKRAPLRARGQVERLKEKRLLPSLRLLAVFAHGAGEAAPSRVGRGPSSAWIRV